MTQPAAPPFHEGGEGWFPPVPDAVDLVVEASTMVSVFAAQRYARVDAMRRDQVAQARRFGAGEVELVERSIRLELAAAMRVTEYAAGRLIVVAEALVRSYPAAWEALAGGRITEKHAEVLVDLLGELPDGASEAFVADAVALAEAEPVGTFRRALRARVTAAQAEALEDRYVRAVAGRRIVVEPGVDGMGDLWVHAPLVELHAIEGRVTAMAKAIKTAGDQRTLDQLRADVVCDLLIDGTTEAMPAVVSGIRAQVVVTVPVLGLLDDDRGDSGDLPVVEGVGPIPLSRARDLCGGAGTWMRVLTHPETGMVLSVGRDRYEPPAALRRLVKWRADRCMAPGCVMPASRCEIDHQIRWADGGHTGLANNTPFCRGHHLIKDNTAWRVRQVPGSGGVIEWTSPTGRRYLVTPERRVPVFTTPAPEPAPPF
ncbi:HNH endonuclease signature motif containing protein [Microbacterium jejuense]|uniref:HNH endonuclease signature motif containing protein n=1 Tax=Microbacterium jejuense TaxID=1263637 RepID=UPI0031E9CC3C